MLSDLEKEQIKLQELYRNEIKAQLSPPGIQTWSQKFVSFLNSAFGLWLLSAIFISGGLKLYDDYKSEKQENQKLTESIFKLDLEIGYRYSRILVKLFELTDKNPDSASLSKNFSEKDVQNIALDLNSSKNNSADFLYIEYSNFSLLTLIAEEKRILKQLKVNDENLNQVINDLTGLEVFYEGQKAKYNDIQSVAISIENNLILPRWKENGFYFLDGNENNPFP